MQPELFKMLLQIEPQLADVYLCWPWGKQEGTKKTGSAILSSSECAEQPIVFWTSGCLRWT